ncbi:MAG: membrane protein insertion efficiency factor YidD [Spirochaetia bacterium]|nr:membrane protein insertion efficiency factor YidD [Spirochaetia bacterium]
MVKNLNGFLGFAIFFIFLQLLFFISCRHQPVRTETPHGGNSRGSGISGGPLIQIIKRHKMHDTHYDGDRCQFYPTCAHWGEIALQNYPFAGFLLLIDRMFYREWGRKEKYIPVPTRKSQSLRFYDPVQDILPLHDNQKASLFLDDFDPL